MASAEREPKARRHPRKKSDPIRDWKPVRDDKSIFERKGVGSKEKKRTSDTQVDLIVHPSDDDTNDDCDKVVHELNSDEDQCQLSEES